MKVRRKKIDKVFSDLVRERSNWHCEACGVNKYSERATLDCAHIMTRRHLITRYHPQNAVALCRSCHMHYTENPFDWVDWCMDKFGEIYMEKLRQLCQQTVKWTPKQREEIYQHYRKVLKDMLEQRHFDHQRIDFDPHELMPTIRVRNTPELSIIPAS